MTAAQDGELRPPWARDRIARPENPGTVPGRPAMSWKEKRRRQSLHCMHGCQADWLATFVLIGCLYMVPLAYPKSHTTFWATERP